MGYQYSYWMETDFCLLSSNLIFLHEAEKAEGIVIDFFFNGV